MRRQGGPTLGAATARRLPPEFAVLRAVVNTAALFAVTGAGLGALLGSEAPSIAGLLLYLYVAELLISHIAALHA